jgi:hypothetical protein
MQLLSDTIIRPFSAVEPGGTGGIRRKGQAERYIRPLRRACQRPQWKTGVGCSVSTPTSPEKAPLALALPYAFGLAAGVMDQPDFLAAALARLSFGTSAIAGAYSKHPLSVGAAALVFPLIVGTPDSP